MKRGTPGIGGLSFFLSLEWNRWEEDEEDTVVRVSLHSYRRT
jgi:hypothetical protein